MDDKELMICLMKRCFELEKRTRKPKDSRRLLVPGMGEAEKRTEAMITASPARNLSTCMIPITKNRKRIKARNTRPWSG